jgi:hypothetical protein
MDSFLKLAKETVEPFLNPAILKLNIDLRVQGLFLGGLLFVFLAWFTLQKPVYKIQQEKVKLE